MATFQAEPKETKEEGPETRAKKERKDENVFEKDEIEQKMAAERTGAKVETSETNVEAVPAQQQKV
jgi:hypothetical protein